MPSFLKDVPAWFLVLCTLGFGASLTYILNKLNGTLNRFQELFDRLFSKYDDHEHRLSKLEGKCETVECAPRGKR